MPKLVLNVPYTDDKPFYFAQETLAYEAQRVLQTKVSFEMREHAQMAMLLAGFSDRGKAGADPLQLATFTVRFPSPAGAILNPGNLSPIRQIAGRWYGGVALATSPWNNLLDWVSYASNPPRCYAAIQGSPAAQAVDRMAADRHLTLRFVPLPFEGAGAMLLKQQCEVAVVDDWASYCSDKDRFKFLGALSDRRSPLYASVPTARDVGLNMIAGEDYGIVGPAGLPEDLLMELNWGFGMAAQSDAHVKAMAYAGLTEAPLDNTAYAAALLDAYSHGRT